MIDFFKENKNIFLITLAVIILLIFLHNLKVITPLENAIISLLKPIQSNLVKFTHSINNISTRFSKISELEEENLLLKEQLYDLIIENNYVKTLLEENKIINPQVEFLQKKDYQYILARIISKGVDPTFKTMTINRGQDNGLEEGMPVIAEQGILVGKLVKVENKSSQVMLLNDTRSLTAAQIQNDQGTQGIILGEFGITLKMDFIPKEDKIEDNQSVITSGLENSIPKGLVIGKIESVKIKTGEFFQSAYIRPILAYDQLQIVSVITNF